MEAIVIVLFVVILTGLVLERRQVLKDRAGLEHVVYVNGIRGKSTVTRLIDAGLRAGGKKVFCKTTGTLPMVIGVDGNKVNLSIKRLEARPQRPAGNNFRTGAPRQNNQNPNQNSAPRPARPAPTPPPAPKTADQLFEEKLKAFMSESDSKISSIRQYSDHRTKSRRR